MVMIFDRAVVAPEATLSMTNFEDPRRIIEIVTSLLGIEPDLYHRCRDTMLRQNTVLIQGFGDGLCHLAKLLGSGGCGYNCCMDPATVASLKISIGDATHDEYGALKTSRLADNLKACPNKAVEVEHLEFELLAWSFNTDDELACFLEIFKKKIKVLKTLEFRGLNIHGRTLHLDSVPQAFDMRIDTVMDAINQRRFESQPDGHFRCNYERNSGPNGPATELWD
ncbi:MAG: hypothetical protein Q9183_006731 [Haloplaca sp. 2 TL-2023]